MALAIGGGAAIAAGANIVPRPGGICEAFRRNEPDRAREGPVPLGHAFPLGTFPAAVKEAASLVGLPV